MKSEFEILKIANTRVEAEYLGNGPPLIFLHGEDGFEINSSLVSRLAHKFHIIAPRLPGFGKTQLQDNIRNIDDVSYIWLDLLDRLDVKDAVILGFSVGGWLALEMATKNTSRMACMVLTGSVGVKFGGAYDRDIEDIYFHEAKTVRSMRFVDAEKDPHYDLTGLSKGEALALARSREAIAKICWKPYFHNPSLRQRLNRVNIPAQVIWGGKDRMTLPKYGRALAKALPDANFAAIPGSAHFPHIEQPDLFWGVLNDFLDRFNER